MSPVDSRRKKEQNKNTTDGGAQMVVVRECLSLAAVSLFVVAFSLLAAVF